METKTTPDQIIRDLGGCGRFQMRINIIAHLMKCLIAWSVMSMIILSMTPPWWCDDVGIANTTISYDAQQEDDHPSNVSDISPYTRGNASIRVNGSVEDLLFKSCVTTKGTKCNKFRYDGSSVVTEFDLVCEDAFKPSLIMSIQNTGSLVGNLVSGQISDLIGRKIPFFGSVGLIIIFNLLGYVSNHWAMFATTRFFIGVGASAFMTTKYSLLSEFSLAQHRAWIIGFPSWPMEASIFACVAWLLHEWKYIQLANTLLGVPCLLAWWLIPESFRWYLSHDKQDKAEEVLRKVAQVNKKPVITTKELDNINLSDKKGEDNRKYTIIDIFRSRYLIRLTLLLSVNWLGLGFISYGISFGIQSLSGSVYMNLFLFSIVGIPSKAIAIGLENCIGRRNTSILCYFVTALGGFAAGIMSYIDTPYQGSLINGFALLANIGITTAWGPIQTMTIELYPTVIRSIGFGSLSVIGRIGAIIGPQIVFLSTQVPGLMFLSCGGLSVLCCLTLLGLNETKNAKLNDKISQTKTTVM